MKTEVLLFLLLASAFSVTAYGQKTLLETTEAVEKAAVAELDLLMQDGDFRKQIEKENIRGSYTYQITVKDKGMVASMLFLEKSADADLKGQNFFNNLVRNHKFTFKVPKGNFYKFKYTFTITS